MLVRQGVGWKVGGRRLHDAYEMQCGLAWPVGDPRRQHDPVEAQAVVRRGSERGGAGRGQLRRLHCWFVWPLQAQMITVVPLVVPCPLASRHFEPYTISCLLEV